MMSFMTLISIGMLGILLLLIVLRSVFALVFGVYILSNLIYQSMVTLRNHNKQMGHSKQRIPEKPSPKKQIVERAATVDPNLALAAQCLIWGNGKTRIAQ